MTLEKQIQKCNRLALIRELHAKYQLKKEIEMGYNKKVAGTCEICAAECMIMKNHEIMVCSGCASMQSRINKFPAAAVKEIIRMKGEDCVRGALGFKAKDIKRLQEENQALRDQNKTLIEDIEAERNHDVTIATSRESTVNKLRADNKALTEKLKDRPKPAAQDLARTISSLKFVLGMTAETSDDEMLQRLDAKLKDVEAQRKLKAPGEESNQRLTTLRNIFISQLVDTRTCPLCDGKFIPTDKTVQDGLSVYRNIFAKTITIE